MASEDPQAVMAVFTSDHIIRPAAGFRDLVDRAYRLVEEDPGTLVTFGVRPDRPATGFGYLELGAELRAAAGAGAGAGAGAARRVKRFREKPDAQSARAFVEAGPSRYLWNSGMFAWRASRFLELAARYEGELALSVSAIASQARSPGFATAMARAYPSLKRVSVDYGVMERASRDPDVVIAALPLSIEWRDIGSWLAYGELLSRDAAGNALLGETALVESSDNIVVSTGGGPPRGLPRLRGPRRRACLRCHPRLPSIPRRRA